MLREELAELKPNARPALNYMKKKKKFEGRSYEGGSQQA